MSNGKLWSAREQLCKTLNRRRQARRKETAKCWEAQRWVYFRRGLEGEEELLLLLVEVVEVEGNPALEQHMWGSAAG